MSRAQDPAPANQSPRTMPTRRTAAETRHAIVESTAEQLRERGARGLNVQAIMERAGISRTTFYRQFSDPYEVVEHLITQLVAHIARQGGAWLRDPSVVGSADLVRPNPIRSASARQPSARLGSCSRSATRLRATRV